MTAKKTDTEETKQYTISVLTENRSGLLHGVTIIFTRRKINIEAINVSKTEIEGISRYHIVINATYSAAYKVVQQLQKLVDVLGAFLYEEKDIYYQELGLYKVPTAVFLNGNRIEDLVRNSGARILVIEEDHILIEKTGHQHEIKELFEKLQPYGVSEFVRSGRIAISKSKRETTAFIRELEKAGETTTKNN